MSKHGIASGKLVGRAPRAARALSSVITARLRARVHETSEHGAHGEIIARLEDGSRLWITLPTDTLIGLEILAGDDVLIAVERPVIC